MELSENVNLYVRKSLFNKLRPSLIIKSEFSKDSDENIKYVFDKYGDFIETLFVKSNEYDDVFKEGNEVEDIDKNITYQKMRTRNSKNILIYIDALKDNEQKYLHLQRAFNVEDMDHIRKDFISTIRFKNKYGLFSINGKTFTTFLQKYIRTYCLSEPSTLKLIDILNHLNFTLLVY